MKQPCIKNALRTHKQCIIFWKEKYKTSHSFLHTRITMIKREMNSLERNSKYDFERDKKVEKREFWNQYELMPQALMKPFLVSNSYS